MPSNALDALETVCRRITLNIPDRCPWRWDKASNLALTVIDTQDEIMVGLPLTLEFSHQWDFTTIDDADAPVRDFFNSGLGIVPGQKVFTTDPVGGLALYVAWWPWGDEERISLRLGLIPLDGGRLDDAEVKRLICGWLNLET